MIFRFADDWLVVILMRDYYTEYLLTHVLFFGDMGAELSFCNRGYSRIVHQTYSKCHIKCQRCSKNPMLMYRNVDLNAVSLKANDFTRDDINFQKIII
jgi:hypothetical protein